MLLHFSGRTANEWYEQSVENNYIISDKYIFLISHLELSKKQYGIL